MCCHLYKARTELAGHSSLPGRQVPPLQATAPQRRLRARRVRYFVWLEPLYTVSFVLPFSWLFDCNPEGEERRARGGRRPLSDSISYGGHVNVAYVSPA